MTHRIYPSAKERLLEIWEYTEEKWGEEQANRYITGLFAKCDQLRTARHRWKPVREVGFEGVYVAKYRHYFIFFRELTAGVPGVISVLHEAMDIPNRLHEALEQIESVEDDDQTD